METSKQIRTLMKAEPLYSYNIVYKLGDYHIIDTVDYGYIEVTLYTSYIIITAYTRVLLQRAGDTS